jgi:hypothetical protein
MFDFKRTKGASRLWIKKRFEAKEFPGSTRVYMVAVILNKFNDFNRENVTE